MIKHRVLFALLVAFGIAGHDIRTAAADVDQKAIAGLALSREGTAAVRTLLDTEVFGGWAVGFAAAPTPDVRALRTILKERNATAALQLIRSHATLAGQLMALAGLYDADPVAFRAALPTYLASKQAVHVWETGCMRSPDRAVADLVRSKDAVQTGGPGKPLPRWTPRRPGDWMVLDLAGGGYSAAMRERPKKP